LADTTFNKESIPFEFYTPEEVINGVETPLIENHFENIYNALITTNTDKLNILNYFETII
jgi:serine/threonine-protein kinase ULK4